nr:hypothetical protein [Tanacetum cinerariifolium]
MLFSMVILMKKSTCYLLKIEGQEFTTIIVYVDDMLITSNSSSVILNLKTALDQKFTVKDLGFAKYFLGIELWKTDAVTHLNQRKYILDLLSDVGLTGSKHTTFPFSTQLKLSLDKGNSLPDAKSHRCDISNLGLSDDNLGYQLTSLTSLKNLDVPFNSLTGNLSQSLSTLSSVTDMYVHPLRLYLDFTLVLPPPIHACLDTGPAPPPPPGRRQPNGNKSPTSGNSSDGGKKSGISGAAIAGIVSADGQSKLRVTIVTRRWVETADVTEVPWSNERPLEYKELNAIIDACAMTRPDISYAVQHLSQFVSAPKDVHMQATTNLLKKSLTGYCIFLGHYLVSWKTKKQLANLSQKQKLPVTVFCDNKSAQQLAANLCFHDIAKYFDIDYHLTRDIIQERFLQSAFIPAHLHLVDIMTKALGQGKHTFLVDKL